jgi:hypothetical protein
MLGLNLTRSPNTNRSHRRIVFRGYYLGTKTTKERKERVDSSFAAEVAN